MRATILFVISFLLYHLSAQASVFVFKSGKKLEGAIRYEDDSTIRITETSGLEMTLRKSELNLPATTAANATPQIVGARFIAPADPDQTGAMNVAPTDKEQARAKVYTNRDVRVERASHILPEPESAQAWQKSLAKMEREFLRLQGSCRAAGTGPNQSKVLRSHTYEINGKQVRVTGYWADPANIEQAKQICARAIDSEESLRQARQDYRDFLERQQNHNNSVSAQ